MAKTIPRGAELLRQVMESRLLDLHTSMLCKVEAFDGATQTVDVQPVVKNVIKNDEGTELVESYPRLRNVPVQYPRSGKFVVVFPLVVGDFVDVIFNEWPIDNFREQGKEAHPVELQRHSLSGAKAYPCGTYPEDQAIGETVDGMIIGHDGGALIRIKDDGSIEIGSSAGTKQAAALADDTKAEIDALRTTVAANTSAINAHVHPTAATGPPSIPTTGVGGIPVSSPPAVGDVGSSKVEIEE